MEESLQLELKKSFGKDVIKTLVAFADSEGGRIIVGIDDDGMIMSLFSMGIALTNFKVFYRIH
jgi:ATP-dependent DNA helicase RecG